MSSFEAPGFDAPESTDERLSSLESTVDELADELAERPTRDEFDELSEERDELAERVDELESQLDEQPQVEFRGDDAELTNVWIGGLPVGVAVDKARRRSKNTAELVAGTFENDELAELADEHPVILSSLGDGTDAGPAGLPDAVRKEMRPIHQMAEEVKSGRMERLADQHSARRGARLFARIHRRAAGEVGDDDLARLVKRASGRYVLQAPDAAEILDADGDPDRPDGPAAETTKRAMAECARLSGSADEPPLVELDTSEHINRLVVDADEFHAAMESIQATRDAARDDGPGDPDRHDPDAAAAELERLTDAEGPPR